MPQPDPTPLSPVERFAARVTLMDPDFLSEAPKHERSRAVLDLVRLGLTWLLQVILWSYAFSVYGAPLLYAVALASLIASLILSLDIQMVSADTAPRGVYRRGPLPKSYWSMVACRVAICVLFGGVTATALETGIFRDEALNATKAETDTQNAPVYADFRTKADALRARVVGPLENEVATLTTQHVKALADAAASSSKIGDAHDRASQADLEKEREDNGYLRPGGDGPLAKDAKKRQDLATADAHFLADHQKDMLQLADGLGSQIQAANLQLAQAQPRYAEELHQLEAERDAALTRATTGPLTVMRGLFMLHGDPKWSGVEWFVSGLAFIFVMGLELTFFISRLFRGASYHDLALETDLKRRGVTLAHEFDADVRERRRRPDLRVVPDRDPPEPHDPANDPHPDPDDQGQGQDPAA